MTARDLIRIALMLIGSLASGETAAASEEQDALLVLNNLLDSWSAEGLIVPNRVRESFALVPGTGTYSIGTGGAFNTARPLEIMDAAIEILTATPTIESPLTILNIDQFAAIAQKAIQSTIPTQVYPEFSFPLMTVTFWPVPSAAYNFILYSKKPLANLASATTAISLPPGYNRGLSFNLAIELAATYGKSTPNEVLTIAAEAKGNIKRQNVRPYYLRSDAAVAPSNTFNIYTGQAN